jgi:thymidylate synthase (FAD)
MKLIKPSFEIIEQQPGLEGIYRQIEYAGRICYRSSNKTTEDSAKPFVDRMIKSGHGSVLEHGTVYLKTVRYIDERGRELGNKLGLTESDFSVPGKPGYRHDDKHYYFKYKNNPYSKLVDKSIDGIDIHYITTNYRTIIENNWLDDLKYICEPTEFHERRVTVRFILSRSIAQEYTRHRVFSYAMESQRYCNYSRDKFNNEVAFIIPCWITDVHPGNSYNIELINNYPLAETEGMSPESIEFIRSLVYSESSYFVLLEAGWKPQQAREVLSNACKTELIMTGFVSDWKHFFELRTASNAHPQARELAIPLEEEFKSLNLI